VAHLQSRRVASLSQTCEREDKLGGVGGGRKYSARFSAFGKKILAFPSGRGAVDKTSEVGDSKESINESHRV